MQFQNKEVTDYLNRNQLKVISFDDNRPWGGWYLINIDQSPNSNFDKKILRVVPNTVLSLQFHGTESHPGHLEIWEACTHIRAIISKESVVSKTSGELCVILENLIFVDVNPGGTLIIGPGYIHALANLYKEDIYVIETRQSQIVETCDQRENNIVRIYDQTNRNNTPSYPDELILRIMDPQAEPNYLIQRGDIFDTRNIN